MGEKEEKGGEAAYFIDFPHAIVKCCKYLMNSWMIHVCIERMNHN
jgi:hypothetical protein